MKILVVRLSSFGDVVHTLPVLYELKKINPAFQVDWLTSKKCFQFLSLIKEIDHLYCLSLSSIIKIIKEKYDFVIDVQGLFKTSVISRICLSKKVIGFKSTREFADIFYDKKVNVGSLFNTKEHIASLNLKLLLPIVPSHSAKQIRFLIPKIDKPDNFDLLNLQNEKPFVVVFPSTTWKSKLWPLDYWFELIKSLSSDFKIVISGSNNDIAYCSPLIKKLTLNNISFVNLLGKTSMKDIIFLIENCNLVIGHDSGPLHLASAIKSDYSYPEVIGIYGPTSVFRNGPFTGHYINMAQLDCIPCRKKICPLGHHKCMKELSPKEVERFVREKLALSHVKI